MALYGCGARKPCSKTHDRSITLVVQGWGREGSLGVGGVLRHRARQMDVVGGGSGERKRHIHLAMCPQASLKQIGLGEGRDDEIRQRVERPSALMQDRRLDSSVVTEEAHVQSSIARVERLIDNLHGLTRYEDKLDVLLCLASVREFLSTKAGGWVTEGLKELSALQRYCVLCLVEIGQEHVLGALCDGLDVYEYTRLMTCLASSLEGVEEFYDSIGGLAGYQLQCLKIIRSENGDARVEDAVADESRVEMLVPKGLDLKSSEASISTVRGIQGVNKMAEIYPLGGAGDRLGLQCEETGDSLPTAVLPYCGRSLLEHLIRDLQAREYLNYRLTGKQHTTPVAVMTSQAKGNHKRVLQLFEANHWFGRGAGAFKLFQQPMVPMVEAQEGRWILSSPLKLVMKPGGHGVIWKLMLDNGVFNWMKNQNRSAAIVRQISNPMAGQDNTLLALAGEGIRGNRTFGFASCERVVGAAEGMNVLLKETKKEKDGSYRTTCRVTNVEYTEFKKHGIEDKGENGSPYSLFPANTNVLYLGLEQVERKIQECVSSGTTDAILPGMILNLKKKAQCMNLGSGLEEHVPAGRLECTMQNLADCFGAEVDVYGSENGGSNGTSQDDLPTFLVYGPRSKVTSSAKRKRKPGSLKIHQTPDGSFFDLQQNACIMLQKCGMRMPELGSVEKYLESGPGFIFLFHPALGPLWDIVAQKISGGVFCERSEVQLEVAEVCIKDIQVDGSLLVHADSVLGKLENDILVYDEKNCGRLKLNNVKILNKGIQWDNPHNVYWRHRVAREESCKITLHGNSEFEASDVVLEGDRHFEVPDGTRMVVTSGENGLIVTTVPLGTPSWHWQYSFDVNGSVRCTLKS